MATTENLVRNPKYKSCTNLVLNDTFLRFLYNLGATSQKESEKTFIDNKNQQLNDLLSQLTSLS